MEQIEGAEYFIPMVIDAVDRNEVKRRVQPACRRASRLLFRDRVCRLHTVISGRSK
jgi:RNase P protein component